jgi:hypothetical protein
MLYRQFLTGNTVMPDTKIAFAAAKLLCAIVRSRANIEHFT